MKENPDHEPISRKIIPFTKKLAEGVAVTVLDLINTSTPPGFEMYLWSEFSKLSNLEVMVRYNLNQVTSGLAKIPLHRYPGVAERIARGILIEEQRLGDLRRFVELRDQILAGEVTSLSPSQ